MLFSLFQGLTTIPNVHAPENGRLVRDDTFVTIPEIREIWPVFRNVIVNFRNSIAITRNSSKVRKTWISPLRSTFALPETSGRVEGCFSRQHLMALYTNWILNFKVACLTVPLVFGSLFGNKWASVKEVVLGWQGAGKNNRALHDEYEVVENGHSYRGL